MNYLEFSSSLEFLRSRRRELLEEGLAIQDAYLEKCLPGGTASKKAKKEGDYYRLRSTANTTLSINNKKTFYIPANKLDYYSKAITRGKELKRLERTIAKVEKQLDKIRTAAKTLGINLEAPKSESSNYAQTNV